MSGTVAPEIERVNAFGKWTYFSIESPISMAVGGISGGTGDDCSMGLLLVAGGSFSPAECWQGLDPDCLATAERSNARRVRWGDLPRVGGGWAMSSALLTGRLVADQVAGLVEGCGPDGVGEA